MATPQRDRKPTPIGPAAAPASRQEQLAATFESEYTPLMKLAYVLTGSQHEAEELVQDAFLELQARWMSVLNPAGYVRVAVVNGARRRGRRRANRRRIVEANTPPIPDEDPRPDRLDLYLTDALARLPSRRRVAVVLAYYGGFSSTEIAESMNCRPSTARSLVRRGLQQLKKELEHG